MQKILFPLIQAGSGSDIFTYNLVSGLNNLSVHADVQYLPGWTGYVPSLMGRICRPEGYDLIHSNTWNGFSFKGLLPVVVTEHLIVHEPFYKKYKSVPQRIYHSKIFYDERRSIFNSDVVVNISRYTQEKMKEVYGYDDSVLIYNGIDQELFKPVNTDDLQFRKKYNLPTGKKILLFSGNPTIRKGGDLLPRIMKEVGDEYILLMTGGLRKEHVQTGQNIIALGKLTLPELIEIYNACDIFLFPTRLEGFGLSVAEAMACGKPVVTTDCSSLPELVIDGKGGFLCEMDNVKEYAESVRIIGEDPSLRRDMGKFNRERTIRKFSLNRMAEEYLRVYKKL